MDLLERLQQAQSTSELPEILESISQVVEFDYFLFGLALPNSITHSDILMYDNYPGEWRRVYDESGYAKRDPIVQYSISNYMPVTWAQISESPSYSRSDLKIMWEAEASGLKAGFSLPIHGAVGEFGMISFASNHNTDEQRLKYAEAIPVIQMLVPAIQDAVKRLRVSESKEPPAKLTKREIECLTWATEGKSSWEISQILGCSERTAIFHLSNAANKLGATNRYQAISKALLCGIINPLC
ncbi:LuxR, transcriptional regulator [Reinekea sp. MED297]|uniref:LuxR, transcriptional regulator n=2 Tax=Reinekea TaxID=230494 RepID=A4BB65_9GAMM|nr:LuxR, transcriptional regulator [Reinekea sp. MED297] [Reinekea blandensis MED297]